jgi:hypothetical protein
MRGRLIDQDGDLIFPSRLSCIDQGKRHGITVDSVISASPYADHRVERSSGRLLMDRWVIQTHRGQKIQHVEMVARQVFLTRAPQNYDSRVSPTLSLRPEQHSKVVSGVARKIT